MIHKKNTSSLFISISVAIIIFFSPLKSEQQDQIIFNHSFHISEIELTCDDCHSGIEATEKLSWNVFPDMDFCLSCHDGDSAEDDCSKCHTNVDEPLAISENWTVSGHSFSHKIHLNIVQDCSMCHNYIYKDEGIDDKKIWIEQECSSCHAQKVESAGQDCSNCHTKDSFKIIKENLSFDHSLSGFMLEGQHAKVNCSKCHTTHEFSKMIPTCISCHTDYHAGNNDMECQICHNTSSWLKHNGIEIHQFTRFPLVGPHINADCKDCHISSPTITFPSLDTNCFSCHSQDYLNAQIPNHVNYNLSQDCEECHSIFSNNWELGYMQHEFFPLTSGHRAVDCSDCHQNNSFQNINIECVSCHLADYNATTDPNHSTNQFPQDCEQCHTTNPGWSPTTFDHNTIYPLLGGHNLVKDDCFKCHSEGYTNTSTNCVDCHLADYNATTDPNHSTNQFPQDCEQCHTTNPGWSPTTFDHNTIYPLLGGHNLVKDDCFKCHSGGYTNTSTNCIDCHLADYNATTDPNHSTNQFPQDCEQCHTTNPGWSPTTFDHNTIYPLLGGHNLVKDDCFKCHSGGYTNTSTNCVDCHLADYNATTDPNHSTNQFPQDCEQCHTTNPGWSPTTFDHNTIYPLLGGHNLVKDDCFKCHSGGYTNTSTNCVDCHLANYNATTDPNHSTNQFPQDCEQCHTTNPGWSPTTFDHNTIYPLLGGHNLVKDDCFKCHSGGYTNTSTNCVDCHLADYNATTDPNHSTNQFPQDCEQCHTTNPGWSPTTFDHNTIYPLLGGHNLVKDDCFKCHSGGYTNTSTNCVDCHLADYNATTDPNHSTNQFPQDCEQCHTTNPGWSPTTFDHNTIYPLLGGHNLVKDDCFKCHSGGYTNTSTNCIDCHLADYNATTDPNHSTNQFPQDCEQCHTTNPGWSPTTFDHDGLYFPIYSGEHNGEWDNCSTCHFNPSNYSEFSCFYCHSENSTRGKHTKHGSLIDGYVYDSYACYDCHPNGEE